MRRNTTIAIHVIRQHFTTNIQLLTLLFFFSYCLAWKNLTDKDKKNHIQECCDGLDISTDTKRRSAAKTLVYISLGKKEKRRKKKRKKTALIWSSHSWQTTPTLTINLGNYGEFKGTDNHAQHLETIKNNNKMLYEMDILLVLKQALSHSCKQIETPTM
jgi:hypothetical protein